MLQESAHLSILVTLKETSKKKWDIVCVINQSIESWALIEVFGALLQVTNFGTLNKETPNLKWDNKNLENFFCNCVH